MSGGERQEVAWNRGQGWSRKSDFRFGLLSEPTGAQAKISGAIYRIEMCGEQAARSLSAKLLGHAVVTIAPSIECLSGS